MGNKPRFVQNSWRGYAQWGLYGLTPNRRKAMYEGPISRHASRPPASQSRTRASTIDMGTFTYFAAIVVMFLVALVLIRGLYGMMKGGNPMTSNKLMQLRILLQAIALALIMLTLWLTGGGRPPQKTSELDVPALTIANGLPIDADGPAA
jgi:hypothetical protein